MSGPPNLPAQVWNQGRRLLRQLLPSARAEVRKEQDSVEATSALGEALYSYVTDEGQLDALLIYPASRGGWHADLVFKRIPADLPDSIGTPAGSPARSREEAEAAAKLLLIAALRVIKNNADRQAQQKSPVFILYGLPVRLRSGLEQVLQRLPESERRYPSRKFAIRRIEEILAELAPQGFDRKAFDSWDPDKQIRLLTVLHAALLTGVLRYPPNPDGAPLRPLRGSTIRH